VLNANVVHFKYNAMLVQVSDHDFDYCFKELLNLAKFESLFCKFDMTQLVELKFHFETNNNSTEILQLDIC
jgi:hypothetical protein